MTNTVLLEEKIVESGLKKNYLALKLGITVQSLIKKINNITQFTPLEISGLCRLLNINSLEEKESIFFATNVDTGSH